MLPLPLQDLVIGESIQKNQVVGNIQGRDYHGADQKPQVSRAAS